MEPKKNHGKWEGYDGFAPPCERRMTEIEREWTGLPVINMEPKR